MDLTSQGRPLLPRIVGLVSAFASEAVGPSVDEGTVLGALGAPKALGSDSRVPLYWVSCGLLLVHKWPPELPAVLPYCRTSLLQWQQGVVQGRVP